MSPDEATQLHERHKKSRGTYTTFNLVNVLFEETDNIKSLTMCSSFTLLYSKILDSVLLPIILMRDYDI